MNVGRTPVASNWPDGAAVLVDALLHVPEDVLHDDHVLLHAHHFGDAA